MFVTDPIDGVELEDLLQSTQFYARGYDGVAVIGMGDGDPEVLKSHPGFKDGGGSVRMVNCASPLCSNTNPTIASSHPTAVASMLIGDLTEGQDSTILGSYQRRARSGVARGGVALNIDFTAGTSYFEYWATMMNTAIVTFSATHGGDPDCEGRDDWSVTANTLFEEGKFVIKSAGNEYNPNDCANECDVSSPGSAIGVMAAAAYLVNENTDDEEIYPDSSLGGTSGAGACPAEGRGRKIIGTTTPSRFEFAYPHYKWPEDGGVEYRYGADWGANNGPPATFCCTSSSAPVLAGSAALYREFVDDVYGSAIENPGRLHSQLLLWSDRTTQSGLITNGYDNRWGAGKLRLRQPDGTGLDGPWHFQAGEECVDDGQAVIVNVSNNTAIDSDVDVLRITTWWYDRRHDSGTNSDNVFLELQSRTGSGAWSTVATSSSSDNRQRLQVDPVTGKEYRVRLVGDDVTSDLAGCGSDSILVYYAAFFEDSDREPAESLDDIRTE